jgi:excinuclease UvrABC nuclease subunit
MLEASKNLDFLQAAQYRDEMLRLEDMLQHLK